ncbi:Uncharacterised protein [Starkeya nomas]|uniref:Uncharacterized protein n=1 Tax=Starkeya nomas TaxID=2666134 RepID=A0A5S9NZC4_9HYPH|nr:hypothetical protein [Starkeya nomas]CAA0096262.1 Uncharacterised protein [Starkeya nomas]
MELAFSALAALSGAGAAGAAAVPIVGGAGALAVPTFLAGSGSAGLAAAAGVPAGLASVLGGVGTAASILSGTTSVLSAMRTMAAGDERASEIETAALDDRAAGAQRRTRFAREALDVLGANDVAAAAAGLDLSYGQAADARSQTLEDLTRESEIDRLQEDARQFGYRRTARRARRAGQLGGFLQLGEGLIGLAGSYA